MLLIDGDIVCYRTAFSREPSSLTEYCELADRYITNIVRNASPVIKDYQVFLTGKGNYRKDIAVTKEYKGNRLKEKPEFLEAVRQHLITNHPSNVSVGEEADDQIAIAATTLGLDSVICSTDKDFNQVPGWHFNFVKKQRYFVSEAQGLHFFYSQILVGDRADNIEGVFGIGVKTVEKHLAGCKTELAYYNKCVELLGSEERVQENGLLLHLRRKEGEMWQPPTER
jgi:hypothetical protein